MFKNIDYLKFGNPKQKAAYKELIELKVFQYLKDYQPILVGTIPIEIDLPESDLDIICTCEDHEKFSALLSELFADKKGFIIKTYDWNGIKCTVATFRTASFEIEIFGQNIPTEKQNAYRHMLIEHKILNQQGPDFKAKIIQLKSEGIKTEPAFAKLLGLAGDAYEALLDLE